MRLRSILVRQLGGVASLRGSADPWLSVNDASDNDGNIMADKSVPGVSQAPLDPSTQLWETEDAPQLNPNDDVRDNFSLAADDIKGANDNGNGSGNFGAFIHCPSGKVVPLRRSFIEKTDSRAPPMISEESDGPNSLHSSSIHDGRSNLKSNPKYSEGVQKFQHSIGTLSSTGLSGMTGLTNVTNFSSVAGISFASASTASCSSDIVSKTSMGHDDDTHAFNNSLYLEGQMLGLTDAKSAPILNRAIEEGHISGLTSTPSMPGRRQSLLRASFSTFAPDDDIGEVNEDDLTYEEDEDASKYASLNSLKTDEIMSTRSRRLSRRNSMQSSLDDLSHMSGRMSICENMSIADSGLFSMTEAELEDWHKEATEWEMEAEIEDNRSMQEAMQLYEGNCEEVDNMTLMSTMMSDLPLR